MNNTNLLGPLNFLSLVYRGILNNLIKAEKLLNLFKVKPTVRDRTI